MKHRSSLRRLLFHLLLLLLFAAAAEHDCVNNGGTIVFSTVGRARYAFDIFSLPMFPTTSQDDELRITDGQSVNYNGYFPSTTSSSFLLSLFSNQTVTPSPSLQLLLYVTERQGSFNIYLDTIYYDSPTNINRRKRSALQIPTRLQIPLIHHEQSNGQISMKDRPSVLGEYLIYVSTHEDSGVPRKSWAAVYSTHLRTGETRRLTPYGIADFSPSVSPSGMWTAVASSGEKGWDGEMKELNTDIYVFMTSDGSKRVKVVEHGGWPCWVDDFTLYFHRSSDDGWWSVYRAILLHQGVISAGSVVVERITPPGLHAFTPAASVANKSFIAMATRRPTSDFRHIELFDLARKEFIEITRPVSLKTHHFNPFISPDGSRVGYHRCRGSGIEGQSNSPLLLENIKIPLQDVSLFRIDGSFPSFSPQGDRIAYVASTIESSDLYVVNKDGLGKRRIFSGAGFSTVWDWKRKGVVYTSIGRCFASVRKQVDIISINVDEIDESGYCSYKQLTFGGGNNAFPSPSPDGKWVVFRSGRSGHKNLYVMDASEGEKGELRRLTEGPWTDTMCNWSPDGEWIAFSSDRHNPGGDSFAIYFIHPNGTGLKQMVHSGEGGRTNHPWFSPDSKRFTFTSDYAAVSAEPIANPLHYQPHGEIFMAGSDGTGIRRLTHNSFEDGTPTWGPMFMSPVDVVERPLSGSPCAFEDCYWLGQAPHHGVQ